MIQISGGGDGNGKWARTTVARIITFSFFVIFNFKFKINKFLPSSSLDVKKWTIWKLGTIIMVKVGEIQGNIDLKKVN